ncbi:FMN-linked oxidoreductase [Mycena venus]|uniref:FMN-linked oxidoreductase n=1 Tax=Mycena venus TaxID=2733690 RepID=A0A8H6Y424_9AGAR|nr:FMN-linked oxidoreductase [Mycena venus]
MTYLNPQRIGVFLLKFVMSVETTAKLFTPIQVGDVLLRHRVVQAPMTRLRVDPNTNVIFPIVKEYYAQRASTPGTLIISEGTVVAKKASAYLPPVVANLNSEKVYSGLAGGHAASPGIWSDAQIAAWREVTDAVHARGSFIYCQLFAMGRAATAPELADPNVDFDLVSASAIPLPGEKITPRALTVEEIQEYVQLFVQAAKNAIDRAGFDGVEIHGANGYLLDAFLQDTANQRTDVYGGSSENRARLLLEVVSATAVAIGESKVGVRISPWSSFQGMLMADPIPTFTHLVCALRNDFPRLAYLHIVEPRVEGALTVEASAHNAGHSNDFIRALWGGGMRRLISAGGYTRVSALERAEQGEIVAFGRPFLANPDLPLRLQKDISLTKGDRSAYYVPTVEGYTTYPFAT